MNNPLFLPISGVFAEPTKSNAKKIKKILRNVRSANKTTLRDQQKSGLNIEWSLSWNTVTQDCTQTDWHNFELLCIQC